MKALEIALFKKFRTNQDIDVGPSEDYMARRRFVGAQSKGIRKENRLMESILAAAKKKQAVR